MPNHNKIFFLHILIINHDPKKMESDLPDPNASCCCFGNNPNEACGYPPKTIRSIIAVSACLISFIILAFLIVYLSLHQQFTEAVGVTGILTTELGTILGYYFGTRSSQEQKNQELETLRLTTSIREQQ